MPGLSVGVTSAQFPECKRGLAVNLAASLARAGDYPRGVCVVDLDPLGFDVSTRLPVRGPVIEDFAGGSVPDLARLGRVHSPELTVVPAAACWAEMGFGPQRPSPAPGPRFSSDALATFREAAAAAVPALCAEFDVVISDVAVGPKGPAAIFGRRLRGLDWLVLAVTPAPGSVASARDFVDAFLAARLRGDVAEALGLAIVSTGDEGTAVLGHDDVEAGLGAPVAARVPQLWGRAVPNLGFGAAFSIPELDQVVVGLFERLRRGRNPAPAESERLLRAEKTAADLLSDAS